MDPLTALGVAANAIQFIQFTGALLEQGWALYEGREYPATNLDLATNDLNQIVKQLSSTTLSRKNQWSLTSKSKSLEQILSRCETLSATLLSNLNDLRVSRPGQKWESFCKAMKAMKKKSELQAMEKSINTLRDQLNTHLLFEQGNQTSQILQALRELLYGTQRMQVTNESLRDMIEKFEKGQSKLQEPECIRPVYTTVQEGETTRTNLVILVSLSFDAIEVRHAQIAKAHKKTFEWIYNSSFGNWLRSGEGIFWLSGKPGSGKSTLFKYLVSNELTEITLRKWAGSKKLFVPKYFFWKSGTELQRSMLGLLRTLLFEVLRSCPELISVVFPDRWQRARYEHRANHEWTKDELLTSLKKVLQCNLSARFCIFVDGLDEYVGDPRDLVALLNDLIHCNNGISHDIKLCLSSRPWNIFEDTFGKDSSRMLRLQDLTRVDIQIYISDLLEKNERYLELKEMDNAYKDLVDEISAKASGVFLWVVFVVKELLTGLTNYDTIQILQKRLRQLPSDLEDYFHHMMNSVEELYQESSARILQICAQAREPLSLLYFSVLDGNKSTLEEPIDERVWENLDPSPWKSENRPTTYNMTEKQLNARCKCLVEVVVCGTPPRATVNFLHRTVKDFLETPSIQKYLKTRAGPRFDASDFILKLSLAHVKLALDADEVEWTNEQCEGWFSDCIAYAFRVAEGHDHKTDLTTTLSLVGSRLFEYLNGRWRRQLLGSGFRGADTHGNLLYIAATVGITSLVQSWNDAFELSEDEFQVILRYALYCHDDISIFQRNFCPDLIQFLLQNGANPNKLCFRSEPETVWEMFLLGICDNWKEWPSETQAIVREITKMLLRHGADPDIVVLGNEHPETSPRQLLLEVVGCTKEDLKLGLKKNPKPGLLRRVFTKSRHKGEP